MRDVRAQMLVNGDRTALRHSNARRRKIQPFDVRAAARGNEDGVRRKRLLSVHRLHDNGRSIGTVLDALYLRSHQNMDAAVICMLQDACGDLRVFTRNEGSAVLHDGDGRAEVGVVRCELQSDIAAADDDELLGQLVQLHHRLARVDVRALCRPLDWRNEGECTCIDEDAFRRDGLLSVRADNAHGMRIDKRCFSVNDDSTRAPHLGVVLFTQHRREAALLCNRRTIALRLCRKAAARRY